MTSVDLECVDGALEPFVTMPARAALLTDFDGTLAPIVGVPEEAVPLPEVPVMLGQLSSALGLVAVVSGRPVSFLRRLLPAGVTLVGQYGLERLVDGELTEHEQAGAWREVISDLESSLLARCPEGTRVEAKGFSLTIHYREHPENESAIREAAAEQARRSGLMVRDARMSIELHPPVDVDKGTTVRDLARNMRSICFIGDDEGDLLAFDTLDDLALEGLTTLRIAVESAESPEELLARADVVLSDANEVVAFLQRFSSLLGL